MTAPPYPPPSRQPFTGNVVDPDPINWYRPIRGQESPEYEESWRMHHGRYLAGLGSAEGLGLTEIDDEPDWSDHSLDVLEAEDDVVGSGIFDPRGSATVHTNMGVFQDHPSMPGYIARHPPFTVNTEVSDLPTGADVVEVPGGGMAYVERDGVLVGPSGGPSPQPAPRQVPPPTNRFDPYVNYSPREPALGRGLGAPDQQQAPWTGRGGRVPRVPGERGVPSTPTYGPVGYRDISQVAMYSLPIGPYGTVRESERLVPVPSTPTYGPVGYQDISQVAMQRIPVSAPWPGQPWGYGATEPAPPKSPGWGSYAFAGALVGAAAAIFMGTVGKKRR